MNPRSKLRLPQGLKPTPYKALCGTAEAVPSPKTKRYEAVPSQKLCGTAEAVPSPKTKRYEAVPSQKLCGTAEAVPSQEQLGDS
jgi:alpha-beta hydrolase superfamily lysophospholipase